MTAGATRTAAANVTGKDQPKNRTTVATTNILMTEPSWSPHRRLNTFVYFVLLSSALVIWLSSYANFEEGRGPMIPYILQAYFPRESSTFNKPSSKQRGRIV
jgi:hypothetical protein